MASVSISPFHLDAATVSFFSKGGPIEMGDITRFLMKMDAAPHSTFLSDFIASARTNEGLFRIMNESVYEMQTGLIAYYTSQRYKERAVQRKGEELTLVVALLLSYQYRASQLESWREVAQYFKLNLGEEIRSQAHDVHYLKACLVGEIGKLLDDPLSPDYERIADNSYLLSLFEEIPTCGDVGFLPSALEVHLPVYLQMAIRQIALHAQLAIDQDVSEGVHEFRVWVSNLSERNNFFGKIYDVARRNVPEFDPSNPIAGEDFFYADPLHPMVLRALIELAVESGS